MSGRVGDQGACNTVCLGNCPEETVNLPSPHPKQIVGGDLSRTGLGTHPGMRFAQVKTVICQEQVSESAVEKWRSDASRARGERCNASVQYLIEAKGHVDSASSGSVSRQKLFQGFQARAKYPHWEEQRKRKQAAAAQTANSNTH